MLVNSLAILFAAFNIVAMIAIVYLVLWLLDFLIYLVKLLFTSKEESYDNFNPSKNEQAEQGRSE